MNDLIKRQTASVRGFKKVDEKEKHLVYIIFENCNAVTRVLTVDHRYGRVLVHAGLEWQRALGVSSEICMVQDGAPGIQLIKTQTSKGRLSRR